MTHSENKPYVFEDSFLSAVSQGASRLAKLITNNGMLFPLNTLSQIFSPSITTDTDRRDIAGQTIAGWRH